MTGESYQAFNAYTDEICFQLETLRAGSYSARTNTEDLLKEFENKLDKLVPDAVKHMENTLESDDTSVFKAHIELEECERFLKDVNFFKQLLSLKQEDEENE